MRDDDSVWRFCSIICTISNYTRIHIAFIRSQEGRNTTEIKPLGNINPVAFLFYFNYAGNIINSLFEDYYNKMKKVDTSNRD